MGTVVIGVDIGQKQDPSAVVVVELLKPQGNTLKDSTGAKIVSLFYVRHVERMELGTSFVNVASRVGDIVRNLVDRNLSEQPRLVVDATGLGAPVTELIHDSLQGTSVTPISATFTHGDRFEVKWRLKEWKVGKAYLVSRLQVLLQCKRIKLPQTDEAQQLANELLEYEIKVDQDANDKYGAFKVGTHDDLVTALGLAVLLGKRPLKRVIARSPM